MVTNSDSENWRDPWRGNCSFFFCSLLYTPMLQSAGKSQLTSHCSSARAAEEISAAAKKASRQLGKEKQQIRLIPASLLLNKSVGFNVPRP